MQLVIANSYITLPLQRLPFVKGNGDLLVQQLLVPAPHALSLQIESALQALRRQSVHGSCYVDVVIEVNSFFSEELVRAALTQYLTLLNQHMTNWHDRNYTLRGWLLHAEDGQLESYAYQHQYLHTVGKQQITAAIAIEAC